MDTETLTKPIRVKGKSSDIKGSFSVLAEVSQDEKKREKGERERERERERESLFSSPSREGELITSGYNIRCKK